MELNFLRYADVDLNFLLTIFGVGLPAGFQKEMQFTFNMSDYKSGDS